MSEEPVFMSLKDEIGIRAKFLEIALARTPSEFILEKGPHAGELVRLETTRAGSTAVNYQLFSGDMLLAVMYTKPPIQGFAQVTNSKVAKDYWRSGIAKKIYMEINADLAQVHAKLQPQWGSLSPDAVRFWLDFAKDDTTTHARLEKIYQEMKESGYMDSYDKESREDDMSWNGEYQGSDKHEKMIEGWKQKGYTSVLNDIEQNLIYPPELDPNAQIEKSEIIQIEGNEEKIAELMKGYE